MSLSGTGGIASAEDFEAFGAAVTAGSALDDYMTGGEAVLLANIDMRLSDKATVVGTAEKPFTGVFNGQGRSILIGNDAINVSEWGLFHTVGAGAVVKDVTVRGSLTSVFAPTKTEKSAHLVSGLAVYNAGASFQDVVTDINFTYNPATYTNFQQLVSQYDYEFAGQYGSLTARVTDVGSSYLRCESKGVVHMKNGSMSHVGGMVGRIAVDDYQNDNFVTVTGCINRGDMNIIIGTNNGDGCKYGCIVGDADSYEISVTDCKNYGNINTDFANGTSKIFSAGGIVGSMYGTITGCYNYGRINAGNERAGDRRYGGIVGICGMNTAESNNVKSFSMTDCHNEGDITHGSNMAGGLIGNLERVYYGEIKNSTNKGKITAVLASSATTRNHQVHSMGGIVGQFRGDLIEGCVNEGRITGYNRLHVGGIAGRGQVNIRDAGTVMVIKNCQNKGIIDVKTNWAAASDAPDQHLRVAGMIIIESGNWRFENCSNTGNLTPMMESPSIHCKNVMLNRSATNTVTLDEASQAQQDSSDNINATGLD